MKAKLKKESDGDYILILNNPKEYPFPLPLLSFKNCQAIERGYDLNEEMSKLVDKKAEQNNTIDLNAYGQGCLDAFQKALELMSDKKFSEEDIHEALHLMNNRMRILIAGEALDIIAKIRKQRNEIIQSLQQTEWDVEVEMEEKCRPMPMIHQKYYEPKLDTDGCLILKFK